MDFDQTSALVRKHEGTVYRIYVDSVGVLTGGVGHAFHVGSVLPVEVVERLFYHDMYNAYKDYDRLKFDLSPVRKAVIINMLFNLGLIRFQGFKRMIEAIRWNDCELVVKEMLDSKWATQVKGRAEELAMMYYDDREI